MPGREPHPFVRLFAAQQQRELAADREPEERGVMPKKPENEYDVVAEGRLDAPPVQEPFRVASEGQAIVPERESDVVEGKETRTPEAPRLVLRPPFVLDIGHDAPVVPSGRDQQTPSLAERKRLAQEKWQSQERGGLSETFEHAKLRSLAQRRFNAAAKDLDYGQEP